MTRRQEITAGRDAYVAQHQHFHSYGVDGPAFTVEAYAAQPPASLAELTGMRDQPSLVLTAGRQAIAFTGRDDELAELRRWWDDPAPRGVSVWHAPGGQGKTRLAQHAAGIAAAAGWRVGAARHRDDTPVAGQPLPDGDGPLLVVVDYAERWPPEDLYRMLADCAQRAPHVRVLLLARSIAWWPAAAVESAKLGFTVAPERHLTALAGRRQLFAAACDRFAEIYELPDRPALTPAGDIADDSAYGVTLGVHMAALAAVDAHARDLAPPAEAGDVSRYLLDRERSYWTRLHGPGDTGAAARTVLLACLVGAQLPEDGLAVLERTGLAAGADRQRLLDAHARCYPPSQADTVLEPLYPDRLAEDFIALSLPGGPVTGHTDTWATTPLITRRRTTTESVSSRLGPLLARDPEGNVTAQTARVLLFLAAAAARNEHVTRWLHLLLAADPALPVAAGAGALLAVTPHTTPPLAAAIYAQLPARRSVNLDPAAAVLAQHLLTHAGDLPAPGRAFLSDSLAIRLANTGRHQLALRPAGDAADIYRRLAQTDPDAYLPAVAASSANLGVCLSALGRREEAFAPSAEAADILRQLADVDPVRHLPFLAMALNNLGALLSTLGRPGQALSPTEGAVEIFRGLAVADPAAYLPDLAMSLSNLGIRLAELGRQAEAVAPAEEATTIRRGLARANPDAHLPDLAESLNNFGVLLAQLGRRKQAAVLSQESAAIYRRLAEVRPDAYLPDLAAALTGLEAGAPQSGSPGQTRAPAEEAADIFRRLAAANPGAHLPGLAVSIRNLGIHLARKGNLDQALASAEEAVEIGRRLAAENPDAHLANLAHSLNSLSIIRRDLGQVERALAPTEEAVAIWRGLPDAHLPLLGRTLNSQVALLHTLGRLDEARAPAEESVAVHRRLADRNPGAHEHHLAAALHDLGIRLAELELLDQALPPMEEAAALFRRLAAADPGLHRPGLANLLHDLGVVLAKLQRTEQARATGEEADAVFRLIDEAGA